MAVLCLRLWRFPYLFRTYSVPIIDDGLSRPAHEMTP